MPKTIEECLGVKHATIPCVDQTRCYMCDADLGPNVRVAAENNKNSDYHPKMFVDTPVFCEFCWGRLTSFGQEAQQAAIRARLIRDAYAEGRLPEDARYIEFGNESIERRNPEAYAKTKTLGNYWICGPQGTGKTCLAYCVLNKAAGDGKSVAVIRGVDINTWRFDDKAVLERYSKAACLLIDDIDKPEWTPRGMEMLWSIVDAWYRNRGDALLVTANMDAKAWRDEVKSKHPMLEGHCNTLLDRVGHQARGGCERIWMGGKSWRRAE